MDWRRLTAISAIHTMAKVGYFFGDNSMNSLSSVLVLALLVVGISTATADNADRLDVFVIDLELGTDEEHRSLRIMMLESSSAEVTLASAAETATDLAGSLTLKPSASGTDQIEIDFEWVPSGNREVKRFKMLVLEGEASSIATIDSNGDSLQIGVVAERASALEREALFSDQLGEGNQSRSTNCAYQYCGGSPWACCGTCVRCDVGCGWFGPSCQVP
ncbi:hypothetical protein [Wenzhouxiangella marina]|uniref:hypothetical protein n=1 Tax=Wenzhouxiangella marina TaxID=1579979 RepID=UPI0012E30F9D|nr:hypothetical protein [Wenzhouxiangella marina]MBB6087063.1 hypothetical protein [Wenzhouxiangella marina]